ncbi:MAG: ABC transporter permease, partial [Cucumibacter sp.]
VLGLTGGQLIGFRIKSFDYGWFFQLAEPNAWGFNNQIPIALAVVAVGAFVLAKTRWGYETFATGGNEQAAIYAGIPTRWVRMRAYLLSALCATLAGLMEIAQGKGATPQAGLSAELFVIAAVIIGGASILGGRGRIIGSFIGVLVVVLINKVLREGWPITRTVIIDGEEVSVQAVFSLPAGAVGACIGVLLIVAVLIEPFIIRKRVPARLWAWLRGAPAPLALETGGVAIASAQTKGAMASDMAMSARGFGKFLARRDALAIMLTVILWLVGLFLRPDYWWHLPNTFAILLNYTELALITIGLTYVIAAGDIDLSVGAVLALAGSATAYSLKVLGLDPGSAMLVGLSIGLLAGVVNGVLTVAFGLPAFIATLGMFYMARGFATWI